MPDRHHARNRPAILPAMFAVIAIGPLSGCSDGGAAYPSLASRPAERLVDTAPGTPALPSPAAVAGAPEPELAGRLDKLVEQARSAKREFDELRVAAERLIAAAGSAPEGSEEWARATQALSGVQSARSQTAQPLSDLDRLEVNDQLHGAQLSPDRNSGRPDTAAIAQAREIVSGLVGDEDAVLARLDGRLAR